VARQWTCRKCRSIWPRTKQKCDCGQRRPERKTASQKALDHLPYEWWVERYGEVCGICGALPKNRRLDRDHDHRTGEPRGLLCWSCNRLLPNRVDAEWLRRASGYLARASGKIEP
jgi:hypothetical protein